MRLSSAGINIDNCYKLEELSGENIESKLLSLEDYLIMPRLELSGEASYVKNGKMLNEGLFPDSGLIINGIYSVCKNGKLLAIVKKEDTFKYLRVFNL